MFEASGDTSFSIAHLRDGTLGAVEPLELRQGEAFLELDATAPWSDWYIRSCPCGQTGLWGGSWGIKLDIDTACGIAHRPDYALSLSIEGS